MIHKHFSDNNGMSRVKIARCFQIKIGKHVVIVCIRNNESLSYPAVMVITMTIMMTTLNCHQDKQHRKR